MTRIGIDEVKKQIVLNSNFEDVEPALVSDLIDSGGVAVLVTPIDKAAPKGCLILISLYKVICLITRISDKE